MVTDVVPSSEPPSYKNASGRCQRYLAPKKRYCKFEVHEPSKDFCVFHSTPEDRIPCPLDPNHTVKRCGLDNHLARCSSRLPDSRPEWYKENHNIASLSHECVERQERTTNLGLDDLESIRRIAAVVTGATKDLTIREDIQRHHVMRHRIQDAVKLKHTQQQASLIGQLSSLGYLEDGDIYIEWGAGKAELSYFLYQALPTQKVSRNFLLIDRDAGRLKFDSRIIKDASVEGKEANTNVVRHKVDIAHIDLARMIEVEFPNITEPVICSISKHLCGSATDLTLSCLRSYTASRKTRMALLIAVCCHQLCTWAALSPEAQTYLSDAGITENDFGILCRLTSWHTSGPSSSSLVSESEHKPHWTGLNYAERSAIGWKCKRLIDSARVVGLRASGWIAELIKYETIDVTTECYALLATKD